MYSSLSALCTLALACFTSIGAAGPVKVARFPIAPASDPFYVPPAGFQSQPPGAILKQRSIDASFLGLIPDLVEAHQLLYRTTSLNGSAIASVTTVFKPLLASTDKFVSFQTAYDSSATLCNPSYSYQLFAPQNDAITSSEMLILQSYLTLGYIVSSPDYEGPDAAFAAGRLSGVGVLDSMRAVSSFSTLKFSSKSPAIVGVGYSGGAIATGWAASLKQNYAPELPVQGWVQGGTPANLTGTLLFLNNGLFSGFEAPAVVGLSAPSAYGAQLADLINSISTAKGRSIFEFASKNCAVQDLFNFAGQSILSYDIQSLGPALLYNPVISAIMKKNTMGVNRNETPQAPVYIYHAVGDEVIPYSNVTTLVKDWCNYGADVTFVSYPLGGHITTEIVGLPGAISFVESAFAGKAPRGCSSKTSQNSTIDAFALGPALAPILGNLAAGVNRFGVADSNLKSNLSILKDSL